MHPSPLPRVPEAGCEVRFRHRRRIFHGRRPRVEYVDSGQKSRNFFIPGRLHTVRPVALREVPVFTENSREYTLIRTEKFGTVVQMEVGAMLVGRIVNHEEKGSTIRGKEKGYFQYGGSTIIVLIEPEQVQIREDILQSSALTKEVPVKMGEVIGHALEHKRTIQ